MNFLPLSIGPVHLCLKDFGVLFFIFIQILIELSVSKQWRPRSDAWSISHRKAYMGLRMLVKFSKEAGLLCL